VGPTTPSLVACLRVLRVLRTVLTLEEAAAPSSRSVAHPTQALCEALDSSDETTRLELLPLVVSLHASFGALPFWDVWRRLVAIWGVAAQLSCFHMMVSCPSCGPMQYRAYAANEVLLSLRAALTLQQNLNTAVWRVRMTCPECGRDGCAAAKEASPGVRVLSLRVNLPAPRLSGNEPAVPAGRFRLPPRLAWGGVSFDFAAAVFGTCGDVGVLTPCGPDAPHLCWLAEGAASGGCRLLSLEDAAMLTRSCVALFYVQHRKEGASS
jgi:hypothetical protein